MSIEPPSDIVLDVVRAADPARRAEATNRLVRIAAGTGEDFAPTLDDVSAPASPRAVASAAPAKVKTADDKAADAYRAFEGMVLSTFVQSAMPESAAAFGEGTAGNVWRTMLAGEIAGEMAKAGGIGIADRLAAASLLKNATDRRFLAAVKPADDGGTT